MTLGFPSNKKQTKKQNDIRRQVTTGGPSGGFPLRPRPRAWGGCCGGGTGGAKGRISWAVRRSPACGRCQHGRFFFIPRRASQERLPSPPPPQNYTSRDPKQLRADGRAQTCQQLVAFCASTRMNQNDAVVNLARVALLHVCCWRASRFSTAPELRLGKRARWRASARA